MEKISGGRRFLQQALCFPSRGCHGAKEAEELSSSRIALIRRKIMRSPSGPKTTPTRRQTDIYKKAIADFEALYPNITVNLKLYTDYGDIYNDVITNIATGHDPECLHHLPGSHRHLSDRERIRWCRWTTCWTDENYGLGGSELAFRLSYKGGDHSAVPCRMQHRRPLLCPALHAFHRGLLCQQEPMWKSWATPLPDTLTWDFIWEVSEAATKKNADGTYAG